MKKLSEIYYNNDHLRSADCHGDKGTAHSYIKTYDPIFSVYQNNDINILEIGVSRGQSLLLWKEYFTPNSKIYGIDTVSEYKKYESDNIRILIGNACDQDFIQNELKGIKFDIIIDDGSHIADEQIRTFNLLFNDYLKDGGVYIIEDINVIDTRKSDFENLHESCVILDTRRSYERWDDVLAIYRK